MWIDQEINTRTFLSTPKEIDQPILKLCQSINPKARPRFVPVNDTKGSSVDECFFNVQRRVKDQGGSILYGWKIWGWPGVFIEAEHHAVWEASGQMIDITPNRDGETTVLFLPDPDHSYDYQGHKRLRNIRAPLIGHKTLENWFKAKDRKTRFIEENSVGRTYTVPADVLARYAHSEQAAFVELLVHLWHSKRPNDPCFCSSGKKFKKCCRPLIDPFR